MGAAYWRMQQSPKLLIVGSTPTTCANSNLPIATGKLLGVQAQIAGLKAPASLFTHDLGTS